MENKARSMGGVLFVNILINKKINKNRLSDITYIEI